LKYASRKPRRRRYLGKNKIIQNGELVREARDSGPRRNLKTKKKKEASIERSETGVSRKPDCSLGRAKGKKKPSRGSGKTKKNDDAPRARHQKSVAARLGAGSEHHRAAKAEPTLRGAGANTMGKRQSIPRLGGLTAADTRRRRKTLPEDKLPRKGDIGFGHGSQWIRSSRMHKLAKGKKRGRQTCRRVPGRTSNTAKKARSRNKAVHGLSPASKPGARRKP